MTFDHANMRDRKRISMGRIHNLNHTTKCDAHINFEICNTIVAVKYLYKYVYKGSFLILIDNIFCYYFKNNNNVTAIHDHAWNTVSSTHES